MQIESMLDVARMRFAQWNVATSEFRDDGFRVEIDNYNRTGRILVRGITTLDGNIKWDVSGNIFEQDKPRIDEVKRVISKALE